jgi:hypothetical protein
MRVIFSFLLCFICFSFVNAQFEFDSTSIKLGLSIGQGQQNTFPYKNKNYRFEHKHIKLVYNQTFFKSKALDIELQVEPTVYWSEHQLLNFHFIQPQYFDNYEELREKFTQSREFMSYAFNFGALFRHYFFDTWSAYGLVSIGPLYSNADTERLKKGLTFTDIFGLGSSIHLKKLQFDFRVYLKHDSNANLGKPNHGHNSLVFETGFLYNL